LTFPQPQKKRERSSQNNYNIIIIIIIKVTLSQPGENYFSLLGERSWLYWSVSMRRKHNTTYIMNNKRAGAMHTQYYALLLSCVLASSASCLHPIYNKIRQRSPATMKNSLSPGCERGSLLLLYYYFENFFSYFLASFGAVKMQQLNILL
jgi:hypothetical protein